MDFKNPVVIYLAQNNLQAHQVCGILIDAGIPAHTVEDISQVGGWFFGGLNTVIHRPKIWIDQSNAERAKPILEEFEAKLLARIDANDASLYTNKLIPVTCEKCGETSDFPAAQRGSVQNCPVCGATVDVGDDDGGIEGWDEYEPEE